MILDLIRKRRSVFPAQYNDKPIARADIEKILEAANWAPNHKRTEPWRFKVMTGESKEKLGLFLSYKYMENVENPKQMKAKKLIENPKMAGAIIAICMQRDPKESLPEWEEVASHFHGRTEYVALLYGNGHRFLLELPPLVKFMDEFFEMEPGEKCLGFFYMGHFDGELPEVTRGPIEDKVVWAD